MPKTKEQKIKEVTDLKDKIQKSKIVLMTSHAGIDVRTIQDLRRQCKSENIEFYAAKKTLLKMALKELSLDSIDLSDYKGLVGIIFGFEDEVTCPNLIYKFSKINDQMQIHDGILEGNPINHEIVINLAKLPSKDELRAKFVGVINGPVFGFVNVLSGNIRGLVQVLNQIREKSV